MSRVLKPRPALALRPSFVSDETCFPVLGLTPRKFRELLIPHCAGHVVRLGHTVLVDLEVAEERLRAMSSDALTDDAHSSDDPAQPTTSAAVLAILGRRRVA